MAFWITQSLEFIYARAGHPAPIVLLADDGKVKELDNGELPIGLFDDTSYEDYSYHLKHGDKLIFYTDGIIENKTKGYPGKEEFINFLFKQSHFRNWTYPQKCCRSNPT